MRNQLVKKIYFCTVHAAGPWPKHIGHTFLWNTGGDVKCGLLITRQLSEPNSWLGSLWIFLKKIIPSCEVVQTHTENIKTS